MCCVPHGRIVARSIVPHFSSSWRRRSRGIEEGRRLQSYDQAFYILEEGPDQLYAPENKDDTEWKAGGTESVATRGVCGGACCVIREMKLCHLFFTSGILGDDPTVMSS